MNARTLLSAIAATTLLASAAIAQPGKDHAPAKPSAPAVKQPETPKMPSPEDMQAEMEKYLAASKPGKNHEYLAKSVGTWDGKLKMWHVPGMPPEESTCTSVITPVFDGRYFKCETTGNFGGMEFKGLGINGYNNANDKFENMWIDNMGTGIMNGTGALSDDGKTLTWTMNGFDPVTKKPYVMREVDRVTGDNSMVLEMYGPGPDGKEFKMMEISYTRAAGAKAAAPAAPSSRSGAATTGRR